MSKKPPKRGEQLVADIERWRLEMAGELGIIEEVDSNYRPSEPRPILRAPHRRPKKRL